MFGVDLQLAVVAKERTGEATAWRNEAAPTLKTPIQSARHHCYHAQPPCTTSTVTNNAPYRCPIMTSAMALQSQHRNANPGHARLSAHSGGTSQNPPAAPPPKAAALPSAQMHPWQCAHSQLRCPLGGSRTSLPPCPCTRTSTRKRHKPESSMIRHIWHPAHILPEPRPLGLFSPRRSPPSCLGSLSSVRLRRHMHNHNIHIRKLEPRQCRHDVAPALAFNHALLAGQDPGSCRQRRPRAR